MLFTVGWHYVLFVLVATMLGTTKVFAFQHNLPAITPWCKSGWLVRQPVDNTQSVQRCYPSPFMRMNPFNKGGFEYTVSNNNRPSVLALSASSPSSSSFTNEATRGLQSKKNNEKEEEPNKEDGRGDTSPSEQQEGEETCPEPETVSEIGGYPAIVLQVDHKPHLVYPPKDGDGKTALQNAQLSEWIQENEITDLWMVAHGWLTQPMDAIGAYDAQFSKVANQTNERLEGDASKRTMGVAAIVWPATQYACTGAAPSVMLDRIDSLRTEFGHENVAYGLLLDKIKLAIQGIISIQESLYDELEESIVESDEPDSTNSSISTELILKHVQDAATALSQLLNDEHAYGIMKHNGWGESKEGGNAPTESNDGITAEQLRNSTASFLIVLDRAAKSKIEELLSSFLDMVAELLDYTTYSKMMRRAELVGRQAISPVARHLKEECPDLKVHLVGNSFGALTVAAIVHAASCPDMFASMALLQGAFSHNAFASDLPDKLNLKPEIIDNMMSDARGMMEDVMSDINIDSKSANNTTTFFKSQEGQYRRIIDDRMVSGPIAITYTKNDQLLGTAYALASRFQGNNGLAIPYYMMSSMMGGFGGDLLNIGGSSDEFGALGSNGALNLKEVRHNMMQKSEAGQRQTYDFEVSNDLSIITNMDATDVIQAHTDVRSEHVADLLIELVRAT